MGVMTSTTSDSMQEIVARLDQRIQAVDEARWLSSRYAAQPARDALIVLYALNYELARVRLAVTDETLGNIRFQWWRDALDELSEGAPRQHDVVIALHHQAQDGHLSIASMRTLIDQHEQAFLAADRALEPEASLAVLAAGLFGAPSDDLRAAIADLAPQWAALRRREAIAAPARTLKIPTRLRPAVGHFRLRRIWQHNSEPGRLQIRLSVLWAMITGHV